MTRAAVMGSGSWGTAFAAVMADAGTDVTLWSRRPELARAISTERVNADYLPELQLPETVRATSDPAEALDGADVVVLAVPSQTLRDNLAGWRDDLPEQACVVSLMKGIEIGTLKRMSEVIADAGVDTGRIAVVSGPNLAKEVAQKQPAAAVVAAEKHTTRAVVAEACAASYFRPYTNGDLVGTEIGGAVKNVIALSVGMAHGLGLGENTTATLLTRGLAETARLGTALGADPQTFLGLAGVGDMVATCGSRLSRNHQFGLHLAEGRTAEEITAATNQTAEGVKSCRSILELATSVNVDMPIVEGVHAILHEGWTPQEMVHALMSRSRKSERV